VRAPVASPFRRRGSRWASRPDLETTPFAQADVRGGRRPSGAARLAARRGPDRLGPELGLPAQSVGGSSGGGVCHAFASAIHSPDRSSGRRPRPSVTSGNGTGNSLTLTSRKSAGGLRDTRAAGDLVDSELVQPSPASVSKSSVVVRTRCREMSTRGSRGSSRAGAVGSSVTLASAMKVRTNHLGGLPRTCSILPVAVMRQPLVWTPMCRVR
jgi:hypothetical protein